MHYLERSPISSAPHLHDSVHPCPSNWGLLYQCLSSCSRLIKERHSDPEPSSESFFHRSEISKSAFQPRLASVIWILMSFMASRFQLSLLRTLQGLHKHMATSIFPHGTNARSRITCTSRPSSDSLYQVCAVCTGSACNKCRHNYSTVQSTMTTVPLNKANDTVFYATSKRAMSHWNGFMPY